MKSSATALPISPEPNQFDDNFLNVIGNEFRFNHAKGLAEWIKNSADAYVTTARCPDDRQFILLRFQIVNPKQRSVFECIDFVGMTAAKIDNALKRWGDPKAAQYERATATYGGHGNGGKFYMRQMFRTSRFITYRDGKLNVFGFDREKRYGYVPDLKNRRMSLENALKFARIDDLEIPEAVLKRWNKTKNPGFTVVVGDSPSKFSGRATVDSILDKLRVHPQARPLVTHKPVIVVKKGDPWGERLTLPELEPKPGFEKPRKIKVPAHLTWEGAKFKYRTEAFPNPELILRTSSEPFGRHGELSALNAVDILGKVGCIASYRVNELGYLANSGEAEFIYGECHCPVLEEGPNNCVRNDREKLVDNPMSNALLDWIRQQVDALAMEMAERRAEERKTHNLVSASLFNQFLDKWKNKFMARLTAELFGGVGIGDSFGGGGQGGEIVEAGPGGDGNGNGGGNGDGETTGGDEGGASGGAGDIPRRGARFPRVLLSGHDLDPLNPDSKEPWECDPRHPPVYQRDIDVEAGIYWINTSRPLADRIMEKYGAESPRWREYMFQRYVDIITKQAIHELGKREEQLNADQVDGLLDDVTSRVHDAAVQDLDRFLFEESLEEPDTDEPGG
jgi:hypothetical protein